MWPFASRQERARQVEERRSRERRRAAHLCALIRVAHDHPDEYVTAFRDELRKRIPTGEPR